MQYASLAIAHELPLNSLKLTVRGHNLRDLPRRFRDIVFQVYLEGEVSEAELRSLAEDASRHCFVENTFAPVIPVITEVHLNGRKRFTLERGPKKEGPNATGG